MAKGDIFTGGGKLYFEKLNVDGSHAPIMFFGKTDGISFTTSVEFKEHYNSEGCTPLLDARYPSKITAEVKFDTAEITLAMQNRAFLGTIVENTQSVATAEAIVVAGELVVAGSIVDVGYYNATAIVVKDVTDATTYVDGTDYTFEAKSGFVTILDTGAISTGDVLHIDVTAPAMTYSVSATMKESSLTGRFTVITSSQSGNNYRYIFKKLSVNQDGDFIVKGDEIGTLGFVGSALVDDIDNGEYSDYLDIHELDSEAC